MARFGKIGWLFGLLFGSLFGMLFAPRKGKDLRSQMRAARRRGKLGLAPLQSDMKQLGQELAKVAREIAGTEPVRRLIETGRSQLKSLSSDFADEVTDFHTTRIKPLQKKHMMRKRGKE